MRVTTKGQVTIPIEVREKFGIFPGTEVEFGSRGETITIRKAPVKKGRQTRGRELVSFLTGKGDVKMTTDAIMKLTRGWDEEDDID